ncbi:MAG TPA: hypothetical protein VE962_06370, partial [Actinomycetota bacterium]|nr:hypothetical protein [Actinomycetota bacterium]
MLTSHVSHHSRILSRALLALVATVLLAVPAQAAPTQKVYSVTVSPNSVGAGQTREYTLAVSNQAGSQSLGSINVTTPSGFHYLAVTQQPAAGSAAIVGSTLQLRNLNLAAASSVTVKFTAEAPCVQTGSNQWNFAAKQSNDFNGTRNDFTLNEAASQRVTSVTGNCQLNWTTQPGSAKVGQTITDTDYDAVDGVLNGASIAAEVLSATYPNSSPGTRVTFSADHVALAIGHDPNPPADPAQLGGTVGADAVNGVATFTPGPNIDLHGLDFTLMATNANMTSDESAEFDVSDAVGECAKGQCNNLHTDGDTVDASLSSTSTTGIIAMSIG